MNVPFIDYYITIDNIHIVDSASYSKEKISNTINFLHQLYPTHQVFIERSEASLKYEWYTHNLLYRLGTARERTKDVDLNAGQPWYVRIAYGILGRIAGLIIS